MRRLSFLVALLCLMCTTMQAATLTYTTAGCNEYIIESQATWEAGAEFRWRVFYRCCGQTCYSETAWTTQTGPMNLCGNALVRPTGGGSGVHYDPDGNAYLDVPFGRGGVISFMPTATCYPFTSDGGAVLVIPAGMLAK